VRGPSFPNSTKSHICRMIGDSKRRELSDAQAVFVTATHDVCSRIVEGCSVDPDVQCANGPGGELLGWEFRAKRNVTLIVRQSWRRSRERRPLSFLTLRMQFISRHAQTNPWCRRREAKCIIRLSLCGSTPNFRHPTILRGAYVHLLNSGKCRQTWLLLVPNLNGCLFRFRTAGRSTSTARWGQRPSKFSSWSPSACFGHSI